MSWVPAAALQHPPPFARQNFDSSATSVDRDFGSGEYAGHPLYDDCVPDVWQPILCEAHCHKPLMRGTTRYGEAQHPGPSHGDILTVGVSNPSGLRQKEDVLLGLGPGIWGMAETQLSATTFRTSAGYLSRQGRTFNREVKLRGGAPAPLR